MSAQRRQAKAIARRQNVHDLGICGGPSRCRLIHLYIGSSPGSEIPGPLDHKKLELVTGVRSVSVGRDAG